MKYLVYTTFCDGEVVSSLMSAGEIREAMDTNEVAGYFHDMNIYDVSVPGAMREVPPSEVCPEEEQKYYKVVATLKHMGEFWTVTIGSHYTSFAEAENAGYKFNRIFGEMVHNFRVVEMREGE